MIPIGVYNLVAFLLGAAALAAGVWLGGLVKHRSALVVRNDFLRDEIARLKADLLLADGRTRILDEACVRMEQEAEKVKEEEAAKGVYISNTPGPGELTLGSIAKEVDDEEVANALGEEILAGSKRLQEQLMKNANLLPEGTNHG